MWHLLKESLIFSESSNRSRQSWFKDQNHLYPTVLGLISPSHRQQKCDLTGTRIPATQMAERGWGGFPRSGPRHPSLSCEARSSLARGDSALRQLGGERRVTPTLAEGSGGFGVIDCVTSAASSMCDPA